ncbi:MAG: metal ABC transporter ATP-binding protein [Chloroflexota bacterium]
MELIKELRTSRFSSHGIEHQSGVPILEVKDISVKYDSGVVLEDISFHLHAGERVAVVGPNGAGKSTLFKVVAGVLHATSGEVKVYGHGPTGHICIAYIPQRSQVDWSFPVNVADVVMMGRIGKLGFFQWPRRRDWELVHQALADVGLESLSKRQIDELSGGQQQRMFIARALAQEAELMLMDEPLTGVDATSQEAIFTILDTLRQRGVTVMIATHDLEQAAGMFDRVMLLNRRMLGFGEPAQVFTPALLRDAYSGHLRLVEAGNEVLALTDTCCEDREDR